jgi:hypothetical protein
MNSWETNLTHIPSNSLLVSTHDKELIRLFCPIKAKCIKQVADINEGQTIHINGIYENEDCLLLYEVNGLKLPHEYFILI